MDSEVLVNQTTGWWEKLRNQINRLLSAAAGQGLEFSAAGWLQTDSDGQPYLYLASDWGAQGRLGDGYSILHNAINSLNLKWNRAPDIKFVSPSTLLGRGLIRAAQQQIVDEAVYTSNDLYGVELIGPAMIFAHPSKSNANAGP